MKTRYHPTKDRLIIRIVYDGNNREPRQPSRGLVIASHPMNEITAGLVVIFGRYAGSECPIDGEPHVICREDEILACVTEEEGD